MYALKASDVTRIVNKTRNDKMYASCQKSAMATVNEIAGAEFVINSYPKQLQDVFQCMIDDAADKLMTAGYNGESGDHGAGRVAAELAGFLAGFYTGKYDKLYPTYKNYVEAFQKEAKTISDEFKEYQRLKAKFEGK